MGPFREGGCGAAGTGFLQAARRFTLFRGSASDAFITIGRNKYAGLAAGGEFSVRAVGVWASHAATC